MVITYFQRKSKMGRRAGEEHLLLLYSFMQLFFFFLLQLIFSKLWTSTRTNKQGSRLNIYIYTCVFFWFLITGMQTKARKWATGSNSPTTAFDFKLTWLPLQGFKWVGIENITMNIISQFFGHITDPINNWIIEVSLSIFSIMLALHTPKNKYLNRK